MKVAILINSKANSAANLDIEQLKDQAKNFKLDFEIFAREPVEIDSTLQNIIHKQYDVVMIAGGDGTIRAAAQTLGGSNTAMAILPIGTFNHFAKALNIPEESEKVLSLIQQKKYRRVDLAEVNDQVFVNNCSIGLYPNILKEREKYTDLFAKNKIIKILLTLINIFKRLPVYKVHLMVNDEKISHDSFLIFVGNNYYSVELDNFGERESLSEGNLSVYVLKCKNKLGFFKIMGKILSNISSFDDCIEQYTAKEFSIDTKWQKIDVALDGEIFRMNLPLEFKIRKKALLVVAE